MPRTLVVIGLAAGVTLTIAVAAQTPLARSLINDAKNGTEYGTTPGDPILSENAALQRTMQGPWPVNLEPTSQTARLLAYSDFSEWAFGVEQEIDEPLVWTVAFEAANAVQSDFGFDPTSDAVAGFWYAWKACSGEQLAFGGLGEGQASELGEHTSLDSSITPCDLREPPPN